MSATITRNLLEKLPWGIRVSVNTVATRKGKHSKINAGPATTKNAYKTRGNNRGIWYRIRFNQTKSTHYPRCHVNATISFREHIGIMETRPCQQSTGALTGGCGQKSQKIYNPDTVRWHKEAGKQQIKE